MAVQDGLFRLDDRVCDTLTEWKDNARKSRITIRQLLNLSAGIDPAAHELRSRRVQDKYAFAVNVPAVAEPGEKFAYGPSYYFAFGELLSRKLAPRIRQRGRWGNRQLVRPELLAECFQPSSANPRYGLTFWLNSGEESARGAKGVKLVQAAGAGKQRLYVIPSRDLVVVRQGLLTKPAFQDREFIQRLVFGKAEVDETKDVPQLISEATRQQVTELFAASDKNGDGRLERSEFPPDRLQYFEPVDLDSEAN